MTLVYNRVVVLTNVHPDDAGSASGVFQGLFGEGTRSVGQVTFCGSGPGRNPGWKS